MTQNVSCGREANRGSTIFTLPALSLTTRLLRPLHLYLFSPKHSISWVCIFEERKVSNQFEVNVKAKPIASHSNETKNPAALLETYIFLLKFLGLSLYFDICWPFSRHWSSLIMDLDPEPGPEPRPGSSDDQPDASTSASGRPTIKTKGRHRSHPYDTKSRAR